MFNRLNPPSRRQIRNPKSEIRNSPSLPPLYL